MQIVTTKRIRRRGKGFTWVSYVEHRVHQAVYANAGDHALPIAYGEGELLERHRLDERCEHCT